MFKNWKNFVIIGIVSVFNRNLKRRGVYMALTKADKVKIIEKLGKNLKDSGNSMVQILLLSERINYLSQHITANPKDFSAKRTLSILISKRKSLLNYLKKHNPQDYDKVMQEINSRK